MEFLKVFFRANPSGFVFKTYGFVHLLMVLTILLGSIYIYINRENLTNHKLARRFLVVGLLGQQLVLLAWYLMSGYFKITESLPLYNCRLAILALGFGELFENKKLKELGIYWGLLGTIVAMAFPELDPFGYDHYTFYSFFLGHLFLFWGGIYVLVVEKISLDEESIFRMIKFSTIYHILIVVVNLIIRGNYCYLMDAPVFGPYFEKFPKGIYTISFISFFNLAIYLEHRIISRSKPAKIKIKSLD